MKHLILKRVVGNGYATYGVLIDHATETPFAVTLELPWLNNQQDISCIPLGFYNCERIVRGSNGKEAFQILNVKGREAILFHVANRARDLKGCIGVGESFDPIYGEPGISQSGKGYAEFMDLLKDEQRFQLQIKGS